MSGRVLVMGVALGLHVIAVAGGQDVERPGEEQGARIIGEVSDGSPPAVAVARKEAEFRILSRTVRRNKGRSVTLERVEAPVEPAPGRVPPSMSREEFAAFANTEEYGQIHADDERPEFCLITATVYEGRATYVKWWPEGGAKPIEAWSNVDFRHLQGFHEFEGRGKRYLFVLSVASLSAKQIREESRQAEPGAEEAKPPELPTLAQRGPVYMVTGGDRGNEAGMGIMDALHDLYEVEQARLRTAHEQRELHRQRREAQLRANPPKPKDLRIQYWPRHSSRDRKNSSHSP